jgi:hypothetical protein
MENTQVTNVDNFLSIKQNSIRLSLVILLAVIITLYIINIKPVSPSVFLISKNQSILRMTTTSQMQSINCIVHMKDRSGRFGNRMFMIASVYGLARLHSCHIYLPSEIIQEMNSVFTFNLSPFLISTIEFNSITNDSSIYMNRSMMGVICQYLPEMTRPNAIPKGHVLELQGFWQSYLHFAKYSDELRERVFVPKQPVLEKVSKFFIDVHQKKFGFQPVFTFTNHEIFKKQLTESNLSTWIGVHVRRSDFIGLQFISSDEYLLTSVKYFVTRFPNAHFIVASDDKPYCQKLFRNQSNIFLTPDSFSVGEDLITLSLCEHSIITGGTFGWWTAFLANGIVIHDTIYASGCEKREHYYPPWFLINGKVRAHRYTNYTL